MQQIARDDHANLRQFGLGLAGLIWLFFWAILPWWFGYQRSWWPWPLAAVIALIAVVRPAGIYPLFRGWMVIAKPLAWFNTRLLLATVFFLLLLPLGVWLFWRGKLHFKTGFRSDVASYKVRRTDFDPKQMEYPF